VTVEIRKEVLDVDLAVQLLAEEGDVRSHDGTEIQQDRRGTGAEAREKLAQRLRVDDRALLRLPP
jgi:hypothetical protein